MLLLLALLAAAPQELPADPPALVFHGNVVLPDGIYLAALDLPRGTKASLALTRTVTRKLRTFLRRGGYDLSSVTATLDGETIRVEIDEGRLDKIVFLGEGVLETVRLKLELDLPGRVFNRDLVERKLRELAPHSGIQSWRWELAPVESAPLPKAQLDDLPPLRDLPFVQPGRPYELFIYTTKAPGGAGWAPQLEIDSLEGGGVGVEYRAPQGFSMGGRVAGALRNHLTVPGSRVVLSRTWAEVRYAGPHLLGDDGPQPVVRARADFLDRQRGDLSLESFDQTVLSTQVSVEQPAGSFARFGVGLGVLRRFLFGLEPIAPLPAAVEATPGAQNRLFGDFSIDLDFTPHELRRDRHRTARVGARFFPAVQRGHDSAVYLGGEGAAMASTGWHELWGRGSATFLSGEVPYSDEEPLGAHVHGPFPGIFTRKLAVVGGEFRYSLLRDLLKVGPYAEALAFREIDRTNDTEIGRAGAVAGIVAAGLFYDQFMFEAYLGAGALSDGRGDFGVSLSVRQAY